MSSCLFTKSWKPDVLVAKGRIRNLRDHARAVYMADAVTRSETEKPGTGSCAQKNVLTDFVQNIEISKPFLDSFPLALLPKNAVWYCGVRLF